MTLILGLGSDDDLLDGFADALADGSPVAVVDRAWPSHVLAAAEASLTENPLYSGEFALFSSGSTARPRGIVRTGASWRASVEPLANLLELTASDVVATSGPLASSLYLFGAWHARASGSRVLLDGGDLAGATIVHAVPARVMGWRTWPSRLHTLVLAGAATPPELRTEASARGVRVVEYYGSAEASFVLVGDDGSLRPFPGVEVRVDGQRQLWSRSPYAFSRYLVGAGSARWDDGWLTVGDLARPENDGWRLLGRPGTINCGGHTITIAEVETSLRAVDGVVDAVVVAIPDSRLGETVGALVQSVLHPDDVRKATRALPAPARPRRLLVRADLPRLGSGKVDRQACAQVLLGGGLGLPGDV